MFSIVHHFVSAHGFYMVFALVALQGFGFFFLPAETALMAAPINAAAILVWVCAQGLGAYGLGQTSEHTLEVIGSAIFVAFVIFFAIGWFYFRRHEDELEKASEKALPGGLRARPEGSEGAKRVKEIAPTEFETHK